VKGDIVLTSNGGYPLDQNIYQAVKCMTAAEACVRPGGVIIVSAACHDGHGGVHFFHQCSQQKSPEAILRQIGSVPAEETEPDQWQTQIFMRVLRLAQVILIADPALKEQIEKMHMTFSPSLENALAIAETLAPEGKYVIIPDGVSVIVEG
jgi:nickel-dependent lactate racemase